MFEPDVIRHYLRLSVQRSHCPTVSLLPVRSNRFPRVFDCLYAIVTTPLSLTCNVEPFGSWTRVTPRCLHLPTPSSRCSTFRIANHHECNSASKSHCRVTSSGYHTTSESEIASFKRKREVSQSDSAENSISSPGKKTIQTPVFAASPRPISRVHDDPRRIRTSTHGSTTRPSSVRWFNVA